MKSLIKQLRAARRVASRQVEQIDAALAALNGAGNRKRTLSAAARKRIGDAQRKRWAKAKRK
jgi:hypothetical protein